MLLDSDVAELYGYETKRIIENVKRNMKRFPENFCFQLTSEETEDILLTHSKIKIETLKSESDRISKKQKKCEISSICIY